MHEGRPPWWILGLGVACLAFLGFACYVHIAGPEPTGLVLRRPPAGRTNGVAIVASVEPDSPATRAGLEPGDALSLGDLRELTLSGGARLEHSLEVERGAGSRITVTIALNRPGLEYWLGARGVSPIIAILLSAVELGFVLRASVVA